MNKQYGTELPFLRSSYEQLDALDEGLIRLSAPTLQDTVLIHCFLGNGENDGSTQVDVMVAEPGSEIYVSRSDNRLLQVADVDPGQRGELFVQPIDHLALRKSRTGLWMADIALENICNQPGVVSFVDLFSYHALEKQSETSSWRFTA